jgi:hypothetical protein
MFLIVTEVEGGRNGQALIVTMFFIVEETHLDELAAVTMFFIILTKT